MLQNISPNLYLSFILFHPLPIYPSGRRLQVLATPPGVRKILDFGLFARATSSSIFARQTWLESLRRLSPGTISAGDPLDPQKRKNRVKKLQEISGYETYHIHT